MFSQFSSAASALVHLAEQECRNASHYYLGTEHLLLAMAIAPPPDVAAYFQGSGFQPWHVKRAVRALMDPPADHPWEGVVITPRVLRIFEAATARALERSALVEPLDILTGIIAESRGVAAQALRSLQSPTARATP
jgi:ATP-dependent Clp protease ATP-binding subunit ClpA